ncbi:hypothetical protein TWF730_002072 [Orbilia blumenaviensis]|uniref:Uncharacterized protein n=1 Tax=Orbilia blumenaviensis TaxID=1796055 RepID=A0AAV9UG17_9PEZI
MRIPARTLVLVPFLISTVSSLSHLHLSRDVHMDPGLREPSPRSADRTPIIQRDLPPKGQEQGAFKKLFLETPVIERLDVKIREALEAMPDAVFEKIATLTGDMFYAYLDALLAGKVLE